MWEKTIINHPFGNGLYHLFMVKLGMFYDCFTTVSCFLRGSYSSLAVPHDNWRVNGILEGQSQGKHEHLQVKKCSIWCGQYRISVSKLCEKAEQCEKLIIHSRFNFIVSNPNQYHQKNFEISQQLPSAAHGDSTAVVVPDVGVVSS